MSGRGWIGVDLDGTLAHYGQCGGLQHIGRPVPKMVNRVRGRCRVMPGILPRMKPIADTEESELPAIFPVRPFITAAAGGRICKRDRDHWPGRSRRGRELPTARGSKYGRGRRRFWRCWRQRNRDHCLCHGGFSALKERARQAFCLMERQMQ